MIFFNLNFYVFIFQKSQANRSDSPTPSSVSTMSEWDDYNETLTQVLTWLIQAETQLKQQEAISQDVDLVKEQFREHEVLFDFLVFSFLSFFKFFLEKLC